MTPNDVVYHIKLYRDLSETWKAFSREEKEELLKLMETRLPADLRKTMLEVKTGQNRLF